MIMTTTSSHSWLMLIKLWWMEGRLKARSVSLGPLFQVLSDFFLSRGSLLIGTLSSTIVIAVLAILVFALVECLRGREPDLPGISQAARMQLY